MLEYLLLLIALAALLAGAWLVLTAVPAPLASDPKVGESWRPVIGVVIVILSAIVVFAQAEVVLP